jgi:hypothetical protein
MWSIHVVKEALYALDRMEGEPSDFEANVLETVTRQIQAGRLPSPKQHRILCDMLEKYCAENPALLRDFMQEVPHAQP